MSGQTCKLSYKILVKGGVGVSYLKKEHNVGKQELDAITEENVVQEFDRILGL